MSDPQILTTLRAKAAEIEAHIESLSGRFANARSDLIHVLATIRMFDPSPEDAEPAKSYHSSARALTRTALFDRCKAALSAAGAPRARGNSRGPSSWPRGGTATTASYSVSWLPAPPPGLDAVETQPCLKSAGSSANRALRALNAAISSRIGVGTSLQR